MTPAKLILMGYITTAQARIFYAGQNWLLPLKFEYFKVETSEGGGVLHVLYKGDYLPYNFVSDNWMDIHNSWDVNIKAINKTKKDLTKTAMYVISQYVSNQGSSYVRSSQSWKWVFRGFKKTWGDFLSSLRVDFYYNPVQRIYYKNHKEVNIFTYWDKLLISKSKPPPIPLVQLDLYGQVLF